MQNASTSSTRIANHPQDNSARLAGVCLLLTAAATAVMVFTRVAGEADQDTLLESLRPVDESWALYGISAVARLLSGLALFVAAWLLLRTWIIRDRWASPTVPYLFALSAVCTTLSGACAILIAAYTAPEISFTGGGPSGEISRVMEMVSGLRWVTGKIGFTAAGLAVIVAARYQWQVGGMLRWIAPTSLIIGVAMQFIWVDSAPILHPIVGTAFFLWLLAIGTMLRMGRVERHFVARYAPQIAESNPLLSDTQNPREVRADGSCEETRQQKTGRTTASAPGNEKKEKGGKQGSGYEGTS